MATPENFFKSGPDTIPPKKVKKPNEYVLEKEPDKVPETLNDSDIYYEDPTPKKDNFENLKSIFDKLK